MEQEIQQLQECPICTKEDPCRAISRYDNKTEICSDCGTLEAALISGLITTSETRAFADRISQCLSANGEWEPKTEWAGDGIGFDIHRVYLLIAKGCYSDFVFPKTD